MSFVGDVQATRIRYDSDPDVDETTGLPTQGQSTTETTIRGTVDPMDDEKLETFVEGDRNVEGIELLTKAELRTGDEQDGTPPDDVRLNGKVYEVRGIKHYETIIPHYEAALVREV